MKRFTLLILSLAMTSSLFAAPQTEIIGSYYKNPEQKAMECYGRGLKAKKKADGEADPAKKAKLYQKAMDELTKSVGYQANYDAYLAIGQVHIALGNQRAGYISCSHALQLEPKSEEAKSCIQVAEKMAEAAAPAPAQDGNGGN
jgi:tetratricopeptide (TPR) repeat protein